MFTPAQITRIAKSAHSLAEGSGGGDTVVRSDRAMGRYVVGGIATRLFPTGTPVAVLRGAIRAMLASAPDGVETVGCWEDDGTVYLDLGDTFTSESRAIFTGRERGELAIFDTSRHASIAL